MFVWTVHYSVSVILGLVQVFMGDLLLCLFQKQLSWYRLYKFDADEYWNMVDAPVQCLIHHLKTVEVAGFVEKHLVIQFLEYLLRHSMVLKKMKIFAEKQTAKYYEERLLNIPKASASAAVLFY